MVLDGTPDAVRAIAVSGSTSFSAPSSAVFVVDTAAGTLREASGQAYTGVVTIVGPKELIVSAVQGDLVLNGGGSLHTIPAGKSARISFDQPADTSCRKQGHVRNTTDRRKIGFYIIGAAAGAGGAYAIWHKSTESPTKPR